MTDFRYDTGDQTYDGSTEGDYFAIFGPDDTDRVYTVTANGFAGDDSLVHIGSDPINIIYNAGDGDDIAEIRFGNVDSNFNFSMGSGNDIVIIGDVDRNGSGNYDLNLGAGQDDIIVYDLTAEIVISDFEAGDTGDRLMLLDDFSSTIDLSNGANPFADGSLNLVQSGNDVILEIREDGATGTLTQTIEFTNTVLADFTAFNFGGLDIQGGNVTGATYTVTESNSSAATIPTFFGSLGDDVITVDFFTNLSSFLVVNGLAGDDIINGTDNGNTLDGGTGDNILYGNGGADRLISRGGGNDQLFGGEGNDRFELYFSENRDVTTPPTITVDGGLGNDRLINIDRDPHDVIYTAGEGDDEALIRSSNADSNYILDMGDGDDVVEIGSASSGFGGEGEYTISLGGGSDEVQMNSVGISFFLVSSPPPTEVLITDFETGASGDLVALNFSDQIGNWEEGENPFEVGAARILQRGDDAVLQFENYEYTFGSSTATAIGWSDVIIFENVNFTDLTSENFDGLSLDNALIDPVFNGTNSDDVLTGRSSDDTLLGLRGDDTLSGLSGDDVLSGSLGEDDLNGGAGADRLDGGSQNDDLFGGTGNDILIGGTGDDAIDGWTGFDTALYTGLSNGVSVDLRVETAQNTGGGGVDTLIRVENLIGSGQDDTLIGSTGRNRLEGGNGDDLLRGLENSDTLLGGGGADRLYGGTGLDRLVGGAENDRLFGEDGRDRLEGGSGDDVLYGGDDVDRLFGGDGDDILIGQDGTDFLFGGAGADRFDFNAITESGVGPYHRDEIRDFSSAEGDKIDLQGIDANATLAGNQAFTLAEDGFTGTAGEVMIQSLVRSGIDVQLVSLDIDGDAQADMQIWVLASELSEADFIL